jgi:hypothetical protein
LLSPSSSFQSLDNSFSTSLKTQLHSQNFIKKPLPSSASSPVSHSNSLVLQPLPSSYHQNESSQTSNLHITKHNRMEPLKIRLVSAHSDCSSQQSQSQQHHQSQNSQEFMLNSNKSFCIAQKFPKSPPSSNELKLSPTSSFVTVSQESMFFTHTKAKALSARPPNSRLKKLSEISFDEEENDDFDENDREKSQKKFEKRKEEKEMNNRKKKKEIDKKENVKIGRDKKEIPEKNLGKNKRLRNIDSDTADDDVTKEDESITEDADFERFLKLREDRELTEDSMEKRLKKKEGQNNIKNNKNDNVKMRQRRRLDEDETDSDKTMDDATGGSENEDIPKHFKTEKKRLKEKIREAESYKKDKNKEDELGIEDDKTVDDSVTGESGGKSEIFRNTENSRNSSVIKPQLEKEQKVNYMKKRKLVEKESDDFENQKEGKNNKVKNVEDLIPCEICSKLVLFGNYLDHCKAHQEGNMEGFFLLLKFLSNMYLY